VACRRRQNDLICASRLVGIEGRQAAQIGGYFYAGVGLEPAKSATRRGGLAVGVRRCLVCRGSCCSWLKMATTWARAWSPPTLPAKTMQVMLMAWGAASAGPNTEMTLRNS